MPRIVLKDKRGNPVEYANVDKLVVKDYEGNDVEYSEGGSSEGDFELYATSGTYKKNDIMTEDDYNNLFGAPTVIITVTETNPYFPPVDPKTMKASKVSTSGTSTKKAVFKGDYNASSSTGCYCEVSVTASNRGISDASAKIDGVNISYPEFQFQYYKIKQ